MPGLFCLLVGVEVWTLSPIDLWSCRTLRLSVVIGWVSTPESTWWWSPPSIMEDRRLWNYNKHHEYKSRVAIEQSNHYNVLGFNILGAAFLFDCLWFEGCFIKNNILELFQLSTILILKVFKLALKCELWRHTGTNLTDGYIAIVSFQVIHPLYHIFVHWPDSRKENNKYRD